jgi:endonuclease YncB( thermonuclease family)
VVLAAFLAALLLAAPAGPAGETLAGPIPAQVVTVIDGDTLAVRARIWLGQEVSIRVRLAGIDAPELRGKCDDEKARAMAAKAYLSAKVGEGSVTLSEVHYGKFAGRVMARVRNAAGEDLSQALVTAKHARFYEGGRREGWCGA